MYAWSKLNLRPGLKQRIIQELQAEGTWAWADLIAYLSIEFRAHHEKVSQKVSVSTG